jgi:hypothetical protein
LERKSSMSQIKVVDAGHGGIPVSPAIQEVGARGLCVPHHARQS